MADHGIKRIEVEGFKSLAKKTSIELRPLTILAGANSSGKSSIMQPLLLFKQTIEAPLGHDPFLLNGSHVRFTESLQMLAKGATRFSFGYASADKSLSSTYDYQEARGLDLLEAEYVDGASKLKCRRGPNGPARLRGLFVGAADGRFVGLFLLPMSMIHLPGLRGVPERTYQVTSVGEFFPGPFDKYAPSVIQHWGARRDSNLEKLASELRELGMASRIERNRISESEIELRVNRMIGGDDLVSIADVGLGVSQVLPVLVGLRLAGPYQLVYIEQPEIHLHPRAQHVLAKPFAEAAKRKVTTVVETHSSLFLLGIQSLIAKGELDPSLVILHWFERNPKTGISNVTSVSPDKTGVFENWPVDFDDVSLNAEREFLDASFRRSKKK